MELKTDRFLLREIVATDIDKVFEGLSHPLVIKHYGVSFSSLEATKEQMYWFEQPSQQWFAICSPENEIFFGAGGLNDIDLNVGRAEIGLWLLPEHWGKGIMKEVLPFIANYGLNTLKLNRIEGFVESENVNCKRAMAKLDFQLEKTIANFEEKDGKPISVDLYVKSKSDN